MIATGCALLVCLLGATLAGLVRAPARSLLPQRPSHCSRWSGRSSAVEFDEVAAYLDALAREVRVGGSLTAAFIAVTPSHAVASPLLHAHRSLETGSALDDVLPEVPVAGGLAVATHAMLCAATVGGPAAPTLDAAAALLRERAVIAADAQAHSAQARLSARVLTTVPIVFALWGSATSARTRAAYTDSPVGATCVGVGLAVNLAGWWWMRRIIARAT
jgi:tight adherence protein B